MGTGILHVKFLGFSVAQADLLLKDPLQFRKDFLLWALDRGISWKDPIILQRILASGLKPDNLQPAGKNSIIGNLISVSYPFNPTSGRLKLESARTKHNKSLWNFLKIYPEGTRGLIRG